MSFKKNSYYVHGNIPNVGILLANLGTPDAPTPQALKPYLKQFLSDQRVIELNPILWKIILNCFILQTRPKRSAKLYQSIWMEEGSPLLVYTNRQAKKVEESLRQIIKTPFAVEVGMRYGNPSIESALEKLLEKGMTKLLVLPLFPQYSATTTAAIFDDLFRVLSTWRWMPELRLINCYHDHPLYINALANSIQTHWQSSDKPEKLLFSFHGIPQRYLDNGDPYHCHCHKTGRLVAEKLNLSKEEYIVCFQSLFGREEWIKPYTIDTISAFPAQGITKLDAMCPGFTSDCLETIEEIDVENRNAFMENGGKKFGYIPCLNDSPLFIECLTQLIVEHSKGWLSEEFDKAKSITESHKTLELYKEMEKS